MVIDTMTATAFTGNPTPVFILDHLEGWLTVECMQLLASQSIPREMGHSETVFLRRLQTPDPSTYAVRWFTPYAEEPFCGHGVLAAAVALHQTHGLSSVRFEAFSGVKTSAVIAPSTSRAGATTVIMTFPSEPVDQTLDGAETVKRDFARALGIREEEVVAIGRNSLMDIVIELNPRIDFSAANMAIDPVKLLKASPARTRSQVVTGAWGRGTFDFAKRVFAYGSEDQATGSTYCVLAPYWATRLGKKNLRAVQTSARRGQVDLVLKEKEGLVEVCADGIKTVEGHILNPIIAKPTNLTQAKL
ncbi:hypothetical protein LTR16_000168 [Cryomyces antarcticus]|uniref:Uncharacterized protein n=1 Tax=Cryomyces antarcticus TaxID=329879 RepID=A0ABR0M0E2_9PEZI|nr:hypothetical protein LTR39_000078 [Cryomyces antarcticus]KAK5020696.1 hypothetical protein LTR60_000295 [Cryomyces antarcticus]KAK5257594.1 hypothetical protein LTR16_000168 [Cryomyces antarcticus]